jgi:NTE family protein
VSALRLGYSTNRDITIGAGLRFEWTRDKPSIASTLALKGTNNFPTAFLYFRHNSLDKPVYPKKGVRTELEGDYVFTQNPGIAFQVGTQNIDSFAGSKPYTRALFHFESYTPVGSRSTVMVLMQTGLNFNYKNNILNEFSIGGLTSTFHNQITFAGLREGSFYSSGLAAFQAGLRYQLYGGVYLTGRANVLFNNLTGKNQFYSSPDFLSGYALTFTYNFALGPLELSAMYSDQWKKILGYVNIGIPF